MRIYQYLTVVVSAVLMWAAFPDPNLPYLAFPAMALLIAATDRVSVGRAAWYSALWSMLFFLAHISWLLVAVKGTPLPWILLSFAQTVLLALWGLLFSATKVWPWARSWWGEAIVAGLLWVGVEQLRGRVPFGGFPWAKLSYLQVDTPLIHLAPIGGEVLVSLAAVVVAVWLRLICATGTTVAVPMMQRWGLLVGVAGIALMPLAMRLPNAQEAGSITVGAVQGNVEQPQLDTFGVEGKVTGNHLRETQTMMGENPPVDLVLWGENALDRDPATSSVVAAQMQEAVSATQVPLMAGFNEYVDDVRINWIGVWYPSGELDTTKYGKQYPVPWGEFVPFRELSEWLAPDAAQISTDMRAMDNPGFLRVELNDGRIIPISVGICFEAGYEFVFSEGIQMGAQMIYIPTNNAQFEDSAESTQQLQMARFRAAEFSRSTWQVSTNGVSAVIRPDGSVLAATERQVADHLVAEAPLRDSITVAALVAEPLARLSIISSLVVGAIAVVQSMIVRLRGRR